MLSKISVNGKTYLIIMSKRPPNVIVLWSFDTIDTNSVIIYKDDNLQTELDMEDDTPLHEQFEKDWNDSEQHND